MSDWETAAIRNSHECQNSWVDVCHRVANQRRTLNVYGDRPRLDERQLTAALAEIIRKPG